MIGVHFKKEFATAALGAIQSGKPIPVPADGWSGRNMLALAGILYAGVFSQGPHHHQIAEYKSQGQHPEHVEAVEETFHQDIHSAIDFLANLTFGVIDNEFDAHFDSEVQAAIWDGTKIHPDKGFKGK